MQTVVSKNIFVFLILFSLKVLDFFDTLANFSRRKIYVVYITTLALCFSFYFYFSFVFFLKEQAKQNNIFVFDMPVSFSQAKINVLGSQDSLIIPTLTSYNPFPNTTAKAVLAIDKKTDTKLFEKQSDLKMAPASTTKLMSALVALDMYDLSDELVIPPICQEISGSKANLPIGTEFAVSDLLSVLLISSAGDATCTLAISKVGIEEFVNLMNDKARELHMDNTYFTNPIGLDGIEDSHYSTAYDLYLLAKASTNNSTIKDIVNQKNHYYTSTDKTFEGYAYTTNRLLWELEGSVGIKTGTTKSAGEVLMYEYQKDEKDIVIIVMGSTDRFTDTKNILDWVLESYSNL